MSLLADLPYLHALGDGGPRTQTQMVVIHATDNTAAAYNEALYATRRDDRTSAHFYVDDTSAYRALPLANVAYGCYPIGNGRSVQFELCGLSNQISDATMRRAAQLVAEVCRMYGIPIVKVGPADLANGVRGICGHGDVTAAWHQGDHTDPGASFPWGTFIGYVQEDGVALKDETLPNQTSARNALDGLADIERNVRDVLVSPVVSVRAQKSANGNLIVAPGSVMDRLISLAELAPELKALTEAPIATGAGPTADQVDAAVLRALLDPAVQAGIGAAIAAHLHVS